MLKNEISYANRCQVEEFDKRWIDLLCKYGNREEFYFINSKNNSTRLAIMQYREMLRNRGYGNVCIEELKETYDNKQYVRLHKMLEDMFLEPINENSFKYIIDELHKKDNSIEELFSKHLQDKNRRILTLILIL